MNKLVLICLLLVVPTAFTATCANEAFTDQVGLEALPNSVNSASLGLCRGLEGVDICCSVDTINSLQIFVNSLVRETVVQAAARDTYLMASRTAVSAVKSTFQTLQTNAKAATTKLATAETAATDASETAAATRYDTFQTRLLPLTTIYDVVEEALGAEDDWSEYQEARATCANKVFEAQGTTLCLACRVDPDLYATFASGQLSYSDAYKTAISGACQPYLRYAETQNTITTPLAYLENLAALNTLVASLNAAADVTTVATDANLATLTTLTTVTAPTTDYQEVPTITSCASAAACVDAYTVLLTNGIAVNTLNLASGGGITPTAASSSRLLGESRALQAVFDPTSDDNASGIEVEFPADVIAAAAANAWRQGGLMTCVVALVAMLLF